MFKVITSINTLDSFEDGSWVETIGFQSTNRAEAWKELKIVRERIKKVRAEQFISARIIFVEAK